jgi:uncharacterized protein YkwD
MRSRIGKLVVTIALTATLTGVAPSATSIAASGAYRDRHAMLHATNDSRSHHALRRVAIDRELSRLARQHSLKMANKQSLFHTADPSSVYLKGIKWHYWGENVGVTGGTIGDLEAAFMASSPHRHNILNRTFQHVAIGAVRVDGALWVTVFFYG